MKRFYQKIDLARLARFGVDLAVLRLDLMHPVSGGNKIFKLRYNLKKAISQKKDTVVTHGGAFSNHIAATAQMGLQQNMKTIGIIRGEFDPLNKTLKFAQQCGMELCFVSRSIYAKRNDADFFNCLKQALPESQMQKIEQAYFIPEGGSNAEGYAGCKEILDDEALPYDYICCAVGTGTTLAGITASLATHQQAIGVAVVNDRDGVNKHLKSFSSTGFHYGNGQYVIFHQFTFGGYAKSNHELNSFVETFYGETKIRTEPVYTGKLFYGICRLVEEGYFKPGSSVLLLHTGGLQYL